MTDLIMPSATVLCGDVRERIAEIPGGSIQCVVTSPPYYGLRDYGHDGQIGLEQTPQAYVDEMVAVFREVRRVLADDGTLWLNIGDSYATTKVGNTNGTGGTSLGIGKGEASHVAAQRTGEQLSGVSTNLRRAIPHGLKEKDLIGIPWRVAFALQADGWYLRQDIIWSKPNPMPESVKDRCTKSHEYLFLLTKSPRYYYDAEAIAEQSAGPGKPAGRKNDASRNDSDRTGIIRGDGITRNKRSVWSVATQPYKGAHFAVFPSQLVEPCILAGSREGDIVLDPFAGSGTALQVAQRLGRKALGIELNPDYFELIQKRLQQQPLDMEVAP